MVINCDLLKHIVKTFCPFFVYCYYYTEAYTKNLVLVGWYFVLQVLGLPENCSHLFTIWICSRNLRKFYAPCISSRHLLRCLLNMLMQYHRLNGN